LSLCPPPLAFPSLLVRFFPPSPRIAISSPILPPKTGQLIKGAAEADGSLRDAALLLGIKLDLEAEVHLTARVKGDVVVGLY
jgi:hypothetical protein